MRLVCASVAVLVSTIAASGQDAPGQTVPRLLQIIQADRPTGSPTGPQRPNNWHATLDKQRWPTPFHVWVSTAGPSQTWLVAEYDSHRSWTRDLALLEKNAALRTAGYSAVHAPALAGSSRNVIAVLRNDLSYRPSRVIGAAKAFSVTIVQTQPGHADDYVSERRIVRSAHEKAATNESYSVYQVTAGLPAGTFMVIIPYDELGQLDDVPSIHGAPYDAALGDEGRQRSRALIASGIASSEVRLFTVDPQRTYSPK